MVNVSCCFLSLSVLICELWVILPHWVVIKIRRNNCGRSSWPMIIIQQSFFFSMDDGAKGNKITIMPFYKFLDSFVLGSTYIIGPTAWNILPVIFALGFLQLCSSIEMKKYHQSGDAISTYKLILITNFPSILKKLFTSEPEMPFQAGF